MIKGNDEHPLSGRRSPKLTHRDYLTLSSMAKLLKKEAAHLEEGLLILDCGCGKKPYLPFFKEKCQQYIGIDIEKNEYVDIVADIEKLPLKDEMFDLVLCLQVIEHVLNPQAVLAEINRVLKNGKTLFLSTHGIWPIHSEPNDFWRWTKYGLKRLLTDFSKVQIYECGGNIASLFQIINFYIPKKSLIKIPLYYLFNRIGESLDKRFSGRSAKLIVNYFVVAKK